MREFPGMQVEQISNGLFFHFLNFGILCFWHEIPGLLSRPILVMVFRICRIVTTDKIDKALHRILKLNDHILYVDLVVFVLTFNCHFFPSYFMVKIKLRKSLLCFSSCLEPNDELWIGLNDIRIQMYFQWSDGTPVTFTKWLRGEPSHENNRQEDCVVMKGKVRQL